MTPVRTRPLNFVLKFILNVPTQNFSGTWTPGFVIIMFENSLSLYDLVFVKLYTTIGEEMGVLADGIESLVLGDLPKLPILFTNKFILHEFTTEISFKSRVVGGLDLDAAGRGTTTTGTPASHCQLWTQAGTRVPVPASHLCGGSRLRTSRRRSDSTGPPEPGLKADRLLNYTRIHCFGG